VPQPVVPLEDDDDDDEEDDEPLLELDDEDDEFVDPLELDDEELLDALEPDDDALDVPELAVLAVLDEPALEPIAPAPALDDEPSLVVEGEPQPATSAARTTSVWAA